MHSKPGLPKVLTLFPLLLVLLAGCASVSTGRTYDHGYPFATVYSVGVIGVEGVDGADAGHPLAQDEIARLFSRALSERGYHVIPRSRIQQLMREQGITQARAAQVPAAEELARILDLDAIFMLRAPQYGDTVEMKVTMLDVASARKIWHGWGTADRDAGKQHPPDFLTGHAPKAQAMLPARRRQVAKLIAELVADLPKRR